MVKRNVSFQKRDKNVDNSITLVLKHHSALNQLYEILQRAKITRLKSARLPSALPSPPWVAFQKPKKLETSTFLVKRIYS